MRSTELFLLKEDLMLAVGLEPTHQGFRPASVPHHGSTNIKPLFSLQSYAPLVPKLGTGWRNFKNSAFFSFYHFVSMLLIRI
jgi:hypothetical protein